MIDIKKLGFSSNVEELFAPYEKEGYQIGRVSAQFKHMFKIYTEQEEMMAEISGKFRYNTLEEKDYPAVGDWVIISILKDENKAVIHNILPRKSKFFRRAAGPLDKEQIFASNVDVVFLVNALNNDFNIRRIERYLIMAWESGANPVIILSKSDLCDDIDEKVREVEEVAIGVPIHVISSINNEGLEAIEEYFKDDRTGVLLGSSGVGKSTIINTLIGEEVQKVNSVREYDDRGRHTSTYREMFILPKGGLIIDTPGIRELQLWEGNEGISETFDDIDTIALKCKFSDCKHDKEPGCAVHAAIENGELSQDRLDNYKKMLNEIKFFNKKQAMKNKIGAKNNKNSYDRKKGKALANFI